MWQGVLVLFYVVVSCICDCFRHVLCAGVMCLCLFQSCLICLRCLSILFHVPVSVSVMFLVSGSISVMFHVAVSVSVMCPDLVICCIAVSRHVSVTFHDPIQEAELCRPYCNG